jgi:hypothetical protein
MAMTELVLWVLLANGVELNKIASTASCMNMARMQVEFTEKGKPIPATSQDGEQSYVVMWECRTVMREAGPTS